MKAAAIAALPALLVLSAAVAASANAADDPKAQVVACIDAAWNNHTEPEGCIGKIAAACLALDHEESEGFVASCYTDEQAGWDGLLNARYKQLIDSETEYSTSNPGDKDLVAPLKAVQRQWLKVRDETCDWEWDSYRGGTIADSAHAACQMRETAYRALTVWRLSGANH